jgi:hypothetical protein
VTFFFDRNIGRAVPKALRVLGLPVVSHDEHFPPNTQDDQWMPTVGRAGWTVIGHDKKFHEIDVELQAIRDHQVGVFYLWGANAKRWDKVRLFAKVYDKIVTVIQSQRPPFIYRVYKSGAFKRVL